MRTLLDGMLVIDLLRILRANDAAEGRLEARARID
jgi:hypothetical protein